ncbi:RNA-binding S4 domain-containing protein [Vibrio natriegens]|uniref:RNA-binding S4 domain-containing protein n=1 Tax=Vibrio natriegens TaxID=691 RepID=UPI0021E7D51C|nr:RNA-binding S4 domain-containing protein [Vibrio natriegens]UYI49601.1 RNA-binding S4 domain-containing protein [Vibrio natriegens]
MTQDYEREAYLDNEELEGEEIEIEAIGIEVDAHPIELYKLFKIANLVSGGGEAKHIIDEGYVAVNGELETRKRRKMYDGDFFEFNQEYYVVVCDAPVTEPEAKEAKPKQAAQKQQSKPQPSSKKPKAASKPNNSNQNKGNKATKPKNSKKAATENKPKPSRDPKSGRNSIDFF